MSNVPAVQDQAPSLVYAAGLPEGRRSYLWREAQGIALVTSVRADLRKKPEDVFAICCTLAVMGVEPTLYTVNQCFVVNGVVGIMGQLLIGVADQRGYDLDITERTPEQASVTLRRRSDGRETSITYSMAEAKKSAKGDVWEKYPADMLIWRAVRRAMRFGAPAIVAGLPAETDDVGTWEAPPLADLPTPALDAGTIFDNDDTWERRVQRLKRQIDGLPSAARSELIQAWGDRNLPPVPHPDFSTRIDEAEDLVDEITARAFGAPAGQEHPVQVRDVPPAHVGPPVAGQGADLPQPENDRARPLPQAIAMAAQEAGVDHHNVISAVTGGEKTSAKDVEAGEETELVFKAIAELKAGKYTLVEREGRWRFVDPPASQMFDQGQPFD